MSTRPWLSLRSSIHILEYFSRDSARVSVYFVVSSLNVTCNDAYWLVAHCDVHQERWQ